MSKLDPFSRLHGSPAPADACRLAEGESARGRIRLGTAGARCFLAARIRPVRAEEGAWGRRAGAARGGARSGAMVSGAYDTMMAAGERPAWLDAAVSREARTRLKAHPAFAEAMTTSAGWLAQFYSGNRLLNRVLNDRGRVLFGFFALYLHALPEAEGGGLTVSRMAALTAETGVCSRGRAKAMLALMRWGGYLALAQPAGDRRAKPLVPTERMLNLHRQRWELQYRMIARLDPALAGVSAGLSDRAFFDALVIALTGAFRAGYRVLDHAPLLTDICDRDSGLMILLSLFSAETRGEAPPAIAELARSFHASRAHVLQLLKDAQAAGVISRDDGGGSGQLTPLGREALADFFAATFALLAGGAHEALKRQPFRSL